MQSPAEERPEQTALHCPASADWLRSEGKVAVALGLLFLAEDVSAGVSSLYEYARIASDLLILGYGVVAWRVPPPSGLLASAAWYLSVGLAWLFMPTLAAASEQPSKMPLVWVVAGIGLLCAGAYRLLMYRRLKRGPDLGTPKN